MLVRAIAKSCMTLFVMFYCILTVQAQSGLIDIDFKVLDPSACNQADGAIHIMPLNGIAPFEYSVDGGATFQADSIFSGLEIGTYILLVRDAQQQFSKFMLAKLQAEGAPSIRGIVMADATECNMGGSLKILTEGGLGDLQYSIDSGRTFQASYVFSNVPSGTYHIVVRNGDQSCPTSYPTISFAPQTPLQYIDVQTVIAQPDCEEANGRILVNVSGGSDAYQYSINNGMSFQSSNTFENLAAGTYNILVRDSISNCEKAPAELAILEGQNCMNCNDVAINFMKIDPDCNTENGQIELNVTGGSGNFSYSIDNGQTYQATNIFSNLAEGNYSINVRDLDFNCEKSGTESVALAPTNCPDCDSLTIQSFLTLPDCDTNNGRIELTVSGGSGDYNISLNGGTPQAALTFDDLGDGNYAVLVKDNITGCEKSFPVINLAEQDCNCSLNLFADTNFSADVPNCIDNGELCLDIALTDLMQLEILDNGAVYSGGLSACEVDTILSYLYFTLPGHGFDGPYRLDRWEVNDSLYTAEFQDINELVMLMNQIDTLANWERDSTSMMINGGSTQNSYGALEITQLSTDMMGVFQANKNYQPVNSKLSLTNGFHEIILRDRTTNCADTLTVDVACSTCPEITLVGVSTREVMGCDNQAIICFSGVDSLDLNTFDITKNGLPFGQLVNNCPDLTLGFEISLDTGKHAFIFTHQELGCQFSYDLEVICIETIDTIRIDTTIVFGESDTICFQEYLMDETINSISPTCEGQSPSVGFEVNNLNHCLVYEGLMLGMDTLCLSVCNTDTICQEVVITVTVIDSMTMDTMLVDTMEMDTMMMDTSCQGIFFENMATVTIMDCEMDGEYCLNLLKEDLANYDLTIDGELFSGVYPDCDVPEQASLLLPEGMYQLILTEKEGICSDTAMLIIECMPMMHTFEDTILVNEMDTFCLDSLNLVGPINTIENTCEDASGEMVIFEIDTLNNCLIYTGIEQGSDDACIVVCDSMGMCDSVMITVVVEEEPDTIPLPIAVNEVDTVEEGSIKTINVLGNDTTNSTLITVTIIESPSNGTAIVNPDMTITYNANDNICDTTDFFTYELCNPSGCDTARVDITIICKVFQIFDGFSPNDDGINDTFTIDGIEDFPNNELQIFNRWGNMVFKQKGYKGQWGGTWNNQKLPDGTYFYLLNDGAGKRYSGFLQIQR